eukprot:406995-Rhodomonas_salina.4
MSREFPPKEQRSGPCEAQRWLIAGPSAHNRVSKRTSERGSRGQRKANRTEGRGGRRVTERGRMEGA